MYTRKEMEVRQFVSLSGLRNVYAGNQIEKAQIPGKGTGPTKDYQMNFNTRKAAFTASLAAKSTAEIERLFRAVEWSLRYETYGRDHEARSNDMNERSWLFKELKRRA